MPYCVNDEANHKSVEIFDLYAGLSHVGKYEDEVDVTAEEGHFIVHAQNQLDGNWYTFNDLDVAPLHITSNKFQSREAYVLLYRKRGSWPVGPPVTDVPPSSRSSTPSPPSPTISSSFSCSSARDKDHKPSSSFTSSLDDNDLRKCRSC